MYFTRIDLMELMKFVEYMSGEIAFKNILTRLSTRGSNCVTFRLLIVTSSFEDQATGRNFASVSNKRIAKLHVYFADVRITRGRGSVYEAVRLSARG